MAWQVALLPGLVPSFQVAQSLPHSLTALGLMCPTAHSDTSYLPLSSALSSSIPEACP